jgi:hypothetical protein
VVVILNPEWAKIKVSTTSYTPERRELWGRAMAMMFDNEDAGMHNKTQILVMHGVNNAHNDRIGGRDIFTIVVVCGVYYR